MPHRFPRRLLIRNAVLAACFITRATAQPRPLNHNDYAAWKNIQNQQLSPDGQFVAYALFPQEGDGEFVVRELSGPREFRHSIGARPAPPRPDPAAAEDAPPAIPAITVNFTGDSRTVVFSTFPAKADVDKARTAEPKPSEAPKNGMVILDLTSGKAARVENVKSFQIPEDGADYIAWLKFPIAPATGGDLVLHRLGDSSERTFADVSEYSLKRDGKTLVYAVSARPATANGVYAVLPDSPGAPAALLTGAGKYAKLTWDEKQSRLAFLSSREDSSGAAPKRVSFRIYSWTAGPSASEIVTPQTPGFRAGFTVSDQGALAFSKDGRHLFFGAAPIPPAALPRGAELAEDLPSFDLWHYKDDYIQPMQKVRAQVERNRSFRAIYHIADKTVVQLADPTMPDITPSDDGLRALGFDDRQYRAMQEYDERYVDSWLINTLSGERHLLSQKAGKPSWSPDGRYALVFNGKDWTTFAFPEGKPTNLTSALSVKFWQEEHDSPGRAPAWGTAGWTKDGKFVLLYDHYDVWAVRPDGSGARNLTSGEGRKQQLIFRCVNLNPDPLNREPGPKGIDSTQPILLRAESAATHDTGFYRTAFDSPAAPMKLIMAAKEFTAPVRAKKADVLLLAESTFQEFPDLQVTNLKFENPRRVTDANPQQSGLLWGSSELFHYRNVDGVKLDGALYKPANFDPKKKYPMLVYIYERLAQNVNHFVPPAPGHNINISYYTSNGYVVITPDIAYTIGYPGQSAQKCVLAAVEEIVNRGFVDENAIGIQGHSWGGYQIAYMITRTNRFRAAAAGAPVADMISAYDGIRWGPGIPRQFQYERTQSRIGGTLWEYPLRFIENSPIFMADRVTTPLLMIHNDADDAVPWYQGIEYYLALRRLGKEVYMFTYNGEPHGLRRRPNQKDYTVRLQQYFDYYLKGAPKPQWMERGLPFVEKTPAAATTDEP